MGYEVLVVISSNLVKVVTVVIAVAVHMRNYFIGFTKK